MKMNYQHSSPFPQFKCVTSVDIIFVFSTENCSKYSLKYRICENEGPYYVISHLQILRHKTTISLDNKLDTFLLNMKVQCLYVLL